MRFLLLFSLFLLAGRLAAQLSPGDLAAAHKDLEGISNCTQCHDIGNKVSNAKCLDCHKEIKTRMDQNRGFHASKEVRQKDCAKCHSDHHGRKFDMVRFDEKNFDHNLTGYELTGRHKSGWSSRGEKIDCRSCHKPDFVDEPELKKRPETFLGLGRECRDCHKDPHQKTLGNDCAKCHTTDEFAPAQKFNHDKSDFPLTGKHRDVACLECHKKETRGGETFQKFADVPFKNCNACHDDPHKNHLGTNCKECHTEQGFDALAGLKKFNHSRTAFELKGKHKQVDCRECHQMEATPLTIFQDKIGVLTTQCEQCHKDPHEGRFAEKCADCHTEQGFRKVQNLGAFDHDRTAFALKGKHEAVDCRKCHVSERMTDPLPSQRCTDCHKDYHEGQFAQNAHAPDCAECHTVEGFSGSSFGIEQHAKTKFPLDGAHVATPCFACHLKDDNPATAQNEWKFRNVGERCVDCHQDPHGGQIAEKWYPNRACEQCHLTSSFRDSRFDHAKTNFKLQGAHVQAACRDCHKPETDFKFGRFAGLPATCSSCHADEHRRQFEQNGATDCARCHGFENWEIARFDHDKTRFKLDGKHANVACEKCHKAVAEGGESFIQYKYKRFECIDCHQ